MARHRETRQMPGNLNNDVYTKRRRIAELGRKIAGNGIYVTEPLDRPHLAGRGPTGVLARAALRASTAKRRGSTRRISAKIWRTSFIVRSRVPIGPRPSSGSTFRRGSGSETRPIGIPTFEDKILQRAVLMLLEPIYEQNFYEGSYGFRPDRSPHDALNALWKETMRISGGWILEVDLRKFFDTLDHTHLRTSSSAGYVTAWYDA